MSHSTVGQRIPPLGRRQPDIWMGSTTEKRFCYQRAHECTKAVRKIKSLKKEITTVTKLYLVLRIGRKLNNQAQLNILIETEKYKFLLIIIIITIITKIIIIMLTVKILFRINLLEKKRKKLFIQNTIYNSCRFKKHLIQLRKS